MQVTKKIRNKSVPSCFSPGNRFDCFPGGKHEDKHKDDKRSRRHVEVIRQHQSGHATHQADEYRQADDPGILHGKEVGRHLGNGDERHQQHDADQPNA